MTSKICCVLAKRLDTVRLGQLNDILRTPGHASFGKLAVEFGVGDKKPIERHKHRCLKIGNPEKKPLVPPPEGLPAVRVSHETIGTGVGTNETCPNVPTGQEPLRPRAPVAANLAVSKDEKVAHVLGQMAAGAFDPDRDVMPLANLWNMAPGSVSAIVAEASRFRRLNRGDLAQIAELAMSYWRRIYNDAMTTEPEFPDTKSKLLAVAAQAQAGWDKAAGLYDDASKIQINIGTDPRFVEAARRYVETVQDVHAAAAVIGARVAERLGDAPPELVAAILAEAAALLTERLNDVASPALPGGP